MACRTPVSRQAAAICWLILAYASAHGMDYYVDGSVAASGNGSASSPFKTIQQGLNAAQAGETVVVRAGTYLLTSALSFPRSGTAGQPITLKATAGETVLVAVQPGLNISAIQTSRSYLTVEGLTFDGNYSTANGLIRLDPGGAFQTLRRCEIRRQGNHLLRIDSSDLLVEDCHIHHAIWRASPSSDAHCTHSQTGLRHTFRRCDIHHATGDLWQGSRDPGAWGDIVFEYCDMHIELADADCNGIAAGTPITENHCDTKVYGTSNSNFTVRGCLIRGTKKGRLGSLSAALNLKENVEGLFIYNNLIYDNAIAFRLRYPSHHYVIYNNFVYDNDQAFRLEDAVTDLVISHNTLYQNTELMSDENGTPVALFWKNNIFAQGTLVEWRGSFSKNLFWNVPAGWPAAGNLSGNPLLVNAATFDLHLAEGSPAINAGLTLTEITGDFDGDPRPIGSAHDIGADEFRYAGDINADGHVDAADLLILAGNWGQSAGSPGFNPACDLNHDGAADVVDMLILAETWGR